MAGTVAREPPRKARASERQPALPPTVVVESAMLPIQNGNSEPAHCQCTHKPASLPRQASSPTARTLTPSMAAHERPRRPSNRHGWTRFSTATLVKAGNAGAFSGPGCHFVDPAHRADLAHNLGRDPKKQHPAAAQIPKVPFQKPPGLTLPGTVVVAHLVTSPIPTNLPKGAGNMRKPAQHRAQSPVLIGFTINFAHPAARPRAGRAVFAFSSEPHG